MVHETQMCAKHRSLMVWMVADTTECNCPPVTGSPWALRRCILSVLCSPPGIPRRPVS